MSFYRFRRDPAMSDREEVHRRLLAAAGQLVESELIRQLRRRGYRRQNLASRQPLLAGTYCHFNGFTVVHDERGECWTKSGYWYWHEPNLEKVKIEPITSQK